MEFTLNQLGFEIIENIYTEKEVNEMLEIISANALNNQFGVRAFLLDNPEMIGKIFTKKLLEIIEKIAPDCNKSIKSIYFDKPPNANWIVNWHQDLTINLSNKKEVKHFKNWRVNKERVIVQPNLEMLERIFTIRIHLDDCTKANGALRVIEQSHQNGVVEIKDWIKNKTGRESICEVKRGGILIMKPLILHASRRTENQENRRVIHIEFTDMDLPNGLNWKEAIQFRASKETTYQ